MARAAPARAVGIDTVTRPADRPTRRRPAWPRLGSAVTLTAASLVGMAGFLYPFFLSEVAQSSEGAAHTRDAPLVFAVLVALAGALFLLELASGGMNAKVASALAVLAASAAVLRLPPLPGGASAFFFLVIISGYVFGPRFGFLTGAMGLLVSAFVAGGFGPWAPYQMFAAGWLGLSSGWLGALRPALARRPWLELGALIAFGALWGFLFGAVMNLWFWPYLATGEETAWQPGLGLTETLRRYWSFYLLTSAGWDAWAAIGNVALLALAGRPLLALLARYRDRFQISFGPAGAPV